MKLTNSNLSVNLNIKSKASYVVNPVECLFTINELLFHINRHARLEFHGEFVLGNLIAAVDGNFFNQPPDKRFIVFGDGGRLLLQEGAHVGDAFF